VRVANTTETLRLKAERGSHRLLTYRAIQMSLSRNATRIVENRVEGINGVG
jgi:hypothetical protein